MRHLRALCLLVISVGILASCTSQPDLVYLKPDQGRTVPSFSADSAYHFVAKQLEFGPRVPNTEAHKAAAQWKINILKKYAGDNGVYA